MIRLRTQDVDAAIDVEDFACHAAAEVADEEGGGVADVGAFDVAAERGALGDFFFHFAGAANRAACEGAEISA